MTQTQTCTESVKRARSPMEILGDGFSEIEKNAKRLESSHGEDSDTAQCFREEDYAAFIFPKEHSDSGICHVVVARGEKELEHILSMLPVRLGGLPVGNICRYTLPRGSLSCEYGEIFRHALEDVNYSGAQVAGDLPSLVGKSLLVKFRPYKHKAAGDDEENVPRVHHISSMKRTFV